MKAEISGAQHSAEPKPKRWYKVGPDSRTLGIGSKHDKRAAARRKAVGTTFIDVSQSDQQAIAGVSEPNVEAAGEIIAPDDLTHARSLSAQELGEHIVREWKPVCEKLVALEPYIKVAFERMEAGEAVCGHTSKKKFCEQVLARTYNAVKFMLGGGNPRNKKPTGDPPKPQPLTELEHKLLGTATNVHEALVDINAGHIEEAIRKLRQGLPTQDRIEEHLTRGVRPTVDNPDGDAKLQPQCERSAAEILKADLANEPDTGVASGMLTRYLETIANEFASTKIKINSVVAEITFNGRHSRVVEGDYLKHQVPVGEAGSVGSGNQITVLRVTGFKTETSRHVAQAWKDGKWQKPRVLFGNTFRFYTVIDERTVRHLVPEAFAPPELPKYETSAQKAEKPTVLSLQESKDKFEAAFATFDMANVQALFDSPNVDGKPIHRTAINVAEKRLAKVKRANIEPLPDIMLSGTVDDRKRGYCPACGKKVPCKKGILSDHRPSGSGAWGDCSGGGHRAARKTRL